MDSSITSPDTHHFTTSGLDDAPHHVFPASLEMGDGPHHHHAASSSNTAPGGNAGIAGHGQQFSEATLVHLTFTAIRSILCSMDTTINAAQQCDTVKRQQQPLDRLMPPSSFEAPSPTPLHIVCSTDTFGEQTTSATEEGSNTGGVSSAGSSNAYSGVVSSRYFSVPVLSEPSSTLTPVAAAASIDNFEVAAAVRSERQMMETFSRKGHALKSRRATGDPSGNYIDADTSHQPNTRQPPTVASSINEINKALGEFASAEVQLLCGLVHNMCSVAAPAATSYTTDSAVEPWTCQAAADVVPALQSHHHHYADTSGSEYGGGGAAGDVAALLTHASPLALHELPHFIMVPPGHRFWFRHTECTFSSLRRPGATLNEAELQFLLDVAFHCPVKPIARLFELLLKTLDIKGKIPQHYHVQLIASSTGRPSSAPEHSRHQHLNGGLVMERRLVPPPSIPLSEYVMYLDTMDNGYFAPPTIPRPLSCCSRLQLAAATRNTILGDIFLEMGEVCHYYRVLSGFPTILSAHHRVMQFMMLSPEGALPMEERFMIAVMAASRHRCEYLVRRYAAGLIAIADDPKKADDFLRKGPNAKLAKLQPIIAVLAHVPWTVSSTHIEDIVESGDWSIPELMQAVCIVCSVLPLCGLTMGLGIPTEVSTSSVLPLDVFPQRPSATLPVSEKRGGSADDLATSPTDTHHNSTQSVDTCGGATGHHHGIHYLQYCGADKVVTVPRISRANNQQIQSISENTFGWESGAAYYVEQYYSQFAELLSNEFTELNTVITQQPIGADDAGAIAMNHMMRKQYPQSSPQQQQQLQFDGVCCGRDDCDFVWRALRLYILNLIGVTAEDFQYERINEVLTRGAKTFAQKSFGYPDRLCLADLTDWSKLATPPSAEDYSATTPNNCSPTPEYDSKRWFNEEVTLVLVALFTCKTRQEGLMVRFLHEFAAYQRSM